MGNERWSHYPQVTEGELRDVEQWGRKTDEERGGDEILFLLYMLW